MDEHYAKVPLEDQKKYLKKYIDVLSIDDRKEIGSLLIINNLQDTLHSCAEGTVINLEKLPADTIEQMYDLMVYKMSKR